MPEIEETSLESNRTRKIRTLTKVRNDTESGKLNWKIIFNDNKVKVFSSIIYYTTDKRLHFMVRSSNVSTEKNNNSLKIIFKSENKNISYNKTVVVNITYLTEIPSLITLIKILWKKYLGIEFTSPLLDSSYSQEASVIEVNDIIEYRIEITNALKQYIRDLNRNINGWEDVFMKLTDINVKARVSKDYNELNDYLWQASELFRNHDPAGRPKWGNN